MNKHKLHSLRSDAAHLVAGVGERLQEGREHLRHGAGQAGEWVRDRACAVSQRVEDRPHQAVVGALVLGFLLGAVLRRSTRD